MNTIEENRKLHQGTRLRKALGEFSDNISAVTRNLLLYGANQDSKVGGSAIDTFRQRDVEVRAALERRIINEERRAKVDMDRMRLNNFRTMVYAQRPALELEEKRNRRLKMFGDPAKEIAEERVKEREEAARRQQVQEEDFKEQQQEQQEQQSAETKS